VNDRSIDAFFRDAALAVTAALAPPQLAPGTPARAARPARFASVPKQFYKSHGPVAFDST
jgi:hypothetical protein